MLWTSVQRVAFDLLAIWDHFHRAWRKITRCNCVVVFSTKRGRPGPEGPSRSTQVTRLKKAGEGGWWKGRGLRACQSNLPADLSSWRERPTSGWSSRSGRAPPTSPSPRRRTGWGGASSWRERPASGWSSCSSRAPPTTPSPLRRTEDGCQEGTFSDPQPAVHHCLVDRVINHG